MSRALADSYWAELVRAARKGLAFDPGTGEPESWAAPEPEPVTWYQHAVAYAAMKWPHLAPHSRASLADSLATVTPGTGSRPPAQMLRAALYGHAFNARRRSGTPGPDMASALAWVERTSLPVSQLSDPRHDNPHRRPPAHRRRLDQHRHPRSSRVVSSTAQTAPSASFPSRRSWSACSASTCMRSGPRRTGGCSAAPAAACSADQSTAASGTPPARPRSART
jgi:hypothetical protein